MQFHRTRIKVGFKSKREKNIGSMRQITALDRKGQISLLGASSPNTAPWKPPRAKQSLRCQRVSEEAAVVFGAKISGSFLGNLGAPAASFVLRVRKPSPRSDPPRLALFRSQPLSESMRKWRNEEAGWRCGPPSWEKSRQDASGARLRSRSHASHFFFREDEFLFLLFLDEWGIKLKSCLS